jgi:hypothetical protein
MAIWMGDEHILNFLFANQPWFRQTNNAGQQNKNSELFVSLISSGAERTEH